MAAHPLIAMDQDGAAPARRDRARLEMPHVDGLTFLQRIMADRADSGAGLLGAGQGRRRHRAARAGVRRGGRGAEARRSASRTSSTSRPCCWWTRCAARPSARPRRARSRRRRCRRRSGTPPTRCCRRCSRPLSVTTDKVVAVGTSTGGTEALRVLLIGAAARRAGIRGGAAHARGVHRRLRRAPEPALPGVREGRRGRRPRAARAAC